MSEPVQAIVSFAIPFSIAVVMLLWGRRLFWLLGGAAFAIAGMFLVALVLDPRLIEFDFTRTNFRLTLELDDPTWPYLAAGGLAAIIGIGFTLKFPKAAVAIVGFLFGALVLGVVFLLYDYEIAEWLRRSLLIIVGTLVAIVAMRQPSETMILVSTIVGAYYFMEAARVGWGSPWGAFVWISVMLFGVIFQANAWRKEEHRRAQQLPAKADVGPTASAS
jgi:hypothetical protein